MGLRKNEIEKSVLKRFVAQAVIDLTNVHNFDKRFYMLIEKKMFSSDVVDEVLSHTKFDVTIKGYSSIIKRTAYKYLIIAYAKHIRVRLPRGIQIHDCNLRCIVDDKPIKIQPMVDSKLFEQKSRPKHDDSLLDTMFDIKTNVPTMESLASSGLSPTGRGRSAIEKQRLYMSIYGMNSRQCGKTLAQNMKVDVTEADKIMNEYKNLHKIDMIDIEARMLGHISELYYLNTKSKPCFLGFPTKENPMENLKVTRPVLVGNINILTAQDFELDDIIRRAQASIEANKDLQELSQHHKNMKAELEEVIKLCVEQLDERIAKRAK